MISLSKYDREPQIFVMDILTFLSTYGRSVTTICYMSATHDFRWQVSLHPTEIFYLGTSDGLYRKHSVDSLLQKGERYARKRML